MDNYSIRLTDDMMARLRTEAADMDITGHGPIADAASSSTTTNKGNQNGIQ